MIEPITFTDEGDVLELRLDDVRTEDSHLHPPLQPIGRHKYCWGELYLVPISLTHHSIVCTRCYRHVPLRIPLEKSSVTYRQLRNYLHRFNFPPLPAEQESTVFFQE